MESRLHITLKKAVERHQAEGNNCWYESTMGAWGGSGSLRADVHYYRKRRSIYVECETRPSMKRLLEKGLRRTQSPWGDVYNLVVPDAQYGRHDWRQLRGYFDKVYAYSVEEDRFTESLDLRTFGALQDAVLDILMPVIRSNKVTALTLWLVKQKNLYRHCIMCLRGRTDPWHWCWNEPCILYKRLWGDPNDHWERPY